MADSAYERKREAETFRDVVTRIVMACCERGYDASRETSDPIVMMPRSLTTLPKYLTGARVRFSCPKPHHGLTFRDEGHDRSCQQRGPRNVQKIDLEAVLAGAQLPALPQSAVSILNLSQSPSNGPAEFAAPIEADEGLACQVLRFVNSSYFGFSGKITSVRLAITMVGVRTIKNFALWSAVFSLLPNPKYGPFDINRLWQDSLRRALFVRTISAILDLKSGDETFSAALLQDMALPILGKAIPDAYAKLLEAQAGCGARLSELERKVFGWDHAEAGALLAERWNLPENFASIIRGHVRLDETLEEIEKEPEAFLVALSSLLPTVFEDGKWREQSQFDDAFAKLSGVGADALPGLFAEIDSGFEELARILRISVPEKSMVDYLEPVEAVS